MKYLFILGRNIELSELMSQKDKIFSIIGHDLRGPIGGFKVLLNMMVWFT